MLTGWFTCMLPLAPEPSACAASKLSSPACEARPICCCKLASCWGLSSPLLPLGAAPCSITSAEHAQATIMVLHSASFVLCFFHSYKVLIFRQNHLKCCPRRQLLPSGAASCSTTSTEHAEDTILACMLSSPLRLFGVALCSIMITEHVQYAILVCMLRSPLLPVGTSPCSLPSPLRRTHS